MIASSLQLKKQNKTIKYIYVQCDFFIIGIYTYIPNLQLLTGELFKTSMAFYCHWMYKVYLAQPPTWKDYEKIFTLN